MCPERADIFWLASCLSATPALGTTAPSFGTQFISVAGATVRYSPGEAGLVMMYSNDPDTALLMLPVEMDVTYSSYLPILLKR